ncbi:glycosyltransferase [Undibacterium sp.]|uniref:glycosyltransferase n=1 Tax=Undibacterium sp. TaxID=1914977 RepID=UPI0025F97AA9|nr:glycosyltransferase [Undibacterium sp.]
MKILLSAFACAPNTGSEAGGGWVYAMELAKTHDVWVLTDESRRKAIESVSFTLPRSLHIIYYRPNLFSAMTLNSRTAHLLYQTWQMGAWRVAKSLDSIHDFDVCWHLTYGVFRQPSWMWKVGKPFIFGPVGGGERAPVRLLQSLPFSEKIRELTRDLINVLSWYLPGLRATYKNAALVIARTEDTKRIFPLWLQDKTKVQQEIGGYSARLNSDVRQGHTGYLKILFAGRLLGMKGIHFAIHAFALFLQNGGQGDLTIIGEGPMAEHLHKLAVSLGVKDKVFFVNRLPQDELFRRYTEFDLLLFPSLHDSGGNVVIEALSFGLPVVCLDLGGPCSFVDETCGVIISAHLANEKEVILGLANSVFMIFSDPTLHKKLCLGALVRAEALTWEKQINRVVELIQSRLRT